MSIGGRFQTLQLGVQVGVGSIRRARFVVEEEAISIGTGTLALAARTIRGSTLSGEQRQVLEATRPYVQRHEEYMQARSREGFDVVLKSTLPEVHPFSVEFDLVAKIVQEEAKLNVDTTLKEMGQGIEFGGRLILGALCGHVDFQTLEKRFIPPQFRITSQE